MAKGVTRNERKATDARKMMVEEMAKSKGVEPPKSIDRQKNSKEYKHRIDKDRKHGA